MPTLGPGSQIYLKRTIEDLQPVVRTSKPYPYNYAETLQISNVSLAEGNLRKSPAESIYEEVVLTSVVISAGYFSNNRVDVSVIEQVQINPPVFAAGVFSNVVVGQNITEEIAITPTQIAQGNLAKIRIDYEIQYESIEVGNTTITGGRHE